MFAQDPSHHSHLHSHSHSQHSQHSQSQPPRRLEGFHVSPTPIPNHQSQSDSQAQHQQMLQLSSAFNPFNGFGSNFGSSASAHVTDDELLDITSSYQSNTPFSSTPANYDQSSNQNTFQLQPSQQQHTPLRTLPRHLDQSSGSPSISNTALSPSDIYSPTSAYNSSAPTHQNDIFAEHHYGSFSSAPPEDAPRSGRATSISGKAPAPRSRSARRPSGSFPANHPTNGTRTSLLSRTSALSIPNGTSESEGRLAISVPTYLTSLNLGSNRPSKTASPDPGGWLIPDQIERNQTSSSIGFHPSNPNGLSQYEPSGFGSSPADSILSHQTQTLGPSMMKEEISSMIGSPVFGRSASVEGHQDLTNLESNNVVLNEKRRKRRESHNAVERRRRENINDRISDLFTLLPPCMIEGGTGTGGVGGTVEEEGSNGNGNSDQFGSNLGSNSINNPKHNKGFILTKSVEYIKQLRDMVQQHIRENNQLRSELDLLKSQNQNPKVNDVFLVNHQHQQHLQPQHPSNQWNHLHHQQHQHHPDESFMNLES